MNETGATGNKNPNLGKMFKLFVQDSAGYFRELTINGKILADLLDRGLVEKDSEGDYFPLENDGTPVLSFDDMADYGF